MSWVWLTVFVPALASAAARYPHVFRDGQGSWLCTDQALIQIAGDLWTFYTSRDGLPSDRVRAVAADSREVWAATPRGLGRMDRSSRRWSAFHAPQPLPANDVQAVALDDRYLWVGTVLGTARFDKISREWKRIAELDGRPVFDIFSQGLSVWFGSADGVYLFERQTEQWRHFGEAEGFSLGEVYEITQQGDNLWFFCRGGLVRFDLRSRATSTFSTRNGLPSPRVTAFAAVEGEIWLGTEKGLAVYNPGTDSISPFLYGRGMPGGAVRGIEVSLPWVYVATEEGLGLFNTLQKTWEEKRESDGLESRRLEGLALAGPLLVLLQPGGYQGYLVQRDEWVSYHVEDVWRGEATRATRESAWRTNLEFTASFEGSYTRSESGWEKSQQFFPELRLGAGRELEGGRSLEGSVRLDVGDATTRGIRDYDAELRLRGAPGDAVRELLLSDEVPLRPREDRHELFQDAWLEGVSVSQRYGGEEASASAPLEVEVQAGLDRGVRAREFFRGNIELAYRLAHQYLTPASEVVKVDGMVLERGTDYIITHTTGQLTFLNPDQLNALSLIEVSYTYEQIPHKASAGLSILQLLPWDNELGSFTRAGAPAYVTDEAGLYNQIDGAAPKYIDRGWVESVFQEYVQGATRVKVEIHDMGSPPNAEDIFEYDRPVSYVVLWEEPDSVALLDQGLASRYAVKMRQGRYYIELSIEGKSRSDEILITLFAQAIRTKGDLSGTLRDSLRDIIGRLRLEAHPTDGIGVGAGLLVSQELQDDRITSTSGDLPGRSQQATLDFSTSHALAGGRYGGRLSSFFQGAGSSESEGGERREGLAAVGDVIYNSEALNVRLDGEVHSRDFAILGSRQTALGTFAGEARADTTWMPWRALTLRLLYDHQRSYLDPRLSPAGEASGVNENLLSKISFLKAGWPTLWALFGHSVLAGAGHRDEKLRFAGSLEYDLASGLLEFLGMRKLLLKAYFDHSQNDLSGPASTPESPWGRLGSYPGRAQNLRLELKAAPTSTEDGYVRFERKTFRPEGAGGLPPMESWELVGGASSRYLEALVPTFNTKMTYSKGRLDSGESLETASAMLAGQLDFFPGRFIEALGSSLLSVGYGYTNAEESKALAMQVHQQKHQLEGRLALGKYDDPWRLESRGKWWRVSEDERQQVSERYTEAINRLTYRPIYTSPITLRFDFSRLERLVGNLWGNTYQLQPSLEWERRWSQDLVSKLRLETPLRLLEDVTDESLMVPVSFRDVTLRPFGEFRFRLRDFLAGSLLRLTLRGYFQWADWFEAGTGAEQAWEASASLYLDWERAGAFIVRLGAQYLRHRCLERVDLPCASYHAIMPSLTAIGRF